MESDDPEMGTIIRVILHFRADRNPTQFDVLIGRIENDDEFLSIGLCVTLPRQVYAICPDQNNSHTLHFPLTILKEKV